MSFSSRVKEELSRQESPARHCRIAETAAIISLCGKVEIDEDDSYSGDEGVRQDDADSDSD